MRMTGGAGDTLEEGGRAGTGADPNRFSKGVQGMREKVDSVSGEAKCAVCSGIACFIIFIFIVVLAGSWVTLDVKDVALAYESLNPYLINKTYPGPGRI